jgi:hypothetical protein
MRNFRRSDSPWYFGGGAALCWGRHGASCKLSASGHLLLMVHYAEGCCCRCGYCSGGCCSGDCRGIGSCSGGSHSCWRRASMACCNSTCIALSLSLLLNLLLHDLSSLHDHPLPGHVLLHEPNALILLAEVY